jgi:hypothetical protein
MSLSSEREKSDQDKKIRLSCKTTSNKSVPNLMDKCNKDRLNVESNYRMKSLAKTYWTNIDKNNLDWQDRLDCNV